MFDLFVDALVDTAKMLPWLFVFYMAIEFIEFKFGGKIREKIKTAGKAGPLVGAALGSVPQCGFSVISTALYTQRLITTGTLLAVYLSTSDEAIPIILAQPDKVGVLLPLLTVKIIIGVVAGYSIDLVGGRLSNAYMESEICAALEDGHLPGEDSDEKGCCGHSCGAEKPPFREIIIHPLVHTLKIFVFLFGVTLLLNFLIFKIGEENLHGLLLGNSIWQPVIVALVGLIPNCAASLAVTQIFLSGGIGFGAAVAGLSASAGLGILVLVKENRNLKDTLRIIGILYAASVISGIVIQYFYK
ncbi:hypothetical protein Tfer_1102 [Thermincola ferriacetica]|uniref:Permease n=1 Tax=Thermincola ferriacetica TaxID=281456 RepID=A0A0L6W432_9FIRM|nr:putative manganese transporter [Thermincola ferriacetica]KNZ70226.1 hypothetical protein Tfer_1102 [Thermincola ferriacetica]